MAEQGSSALDLFDELQIPPKDLAPSEIAFLVSLTSRKESFCVCDPHLPDVPIVSVSPGFCEMLGYDREDIVGKNCRFLQGKDTAKSDVAKIRRAISKERAVSVCLLNYTKAGEPFYNQFYITPQYDRNKQLAFFVGVQTKVEMLAPGQELRNVACALRTGQAFEETTVQTSTDDQEAYDVNKLGAASALTMNKKERKKIPTYKIEKGWDYYSSLECLMKDPVGKASFLKFANEAMCAENLLYYNDVDAIKAELDLKVQAKMIADLYEKYLSPSATLMVNLAGSTHKAITSGVNAGEESPSASLLRNVMQSQRQVFLMIEEDVFVRYLSSDKCQDWRDWCLKKPQRSLCF